MKACTMLTIVAVLSTSLQAQVTSLPGKPGDKPSDTRDYINSITWADALPYSSATFYVKSSAKDSALIKVVPAMGTQYAPWDEAIKPGKPGYITARIDNLEKKRIDALNMNPDDTGYLWIGARHLALHGPAIYVVLADGTSPRHRNKKFIGACDKQHDVPRVRSTEGYDCPGGIRTLQKLHPASMRSMFYLGASGLWISCRGGCCEVRLT